MIDPAPANPNHFASTSEAHALVCLDLKNSAFFNGGPAHCPGHSFLLTASLARPNTPHAPHFQALLLFRGLKFHTLKIVRGI